MVLEAALALHFGIFETDCLLEVTSEAALLLHLGLIEMGDESAQAPHFGQIKMIAEVAFALRLFLIEKVALALHSSLTREPQ